MNFKTHIKSYKNHKTIHNTPDQWKIFENTHEAIIDQETFNIVHKIRQGKKRPTRMGEMPMFSGLLYCADCGSKMTLHRKMDDPAEKYHYYCGNYRKSPSTCTAHYIRNVVVEQIILENVKEVIGYVSGYEDEFIKAVTDTDLKERNKGLAKKKKRLLEIQTRIKELDKLFQRIYEDNVIGKLSDQRFMKLSQGYDTEQAELQTEQEQIQEEVRNGEDNISVPQLSSKKNANMMFVGFSCNKICNFLSLRELRMPQIRHF